MRITPCRAMKLFRSVHGSRASRRRAGLVIFLPSRSRKESAVVNNFYRK